MKKLLCCAAFFMALAVASPTWATDTALINGINMPVVAPGNFVGPVAAYFPAGGLFSPTNPGYISTGNPATIYSAQQTVTASAVALAAQALVNGIIITAATTNTGTTYVGSATVTAGNGYALIPGQSVSYGVSNTNAVYIIGTASDKVYVTGN